MKVWLLQRAEPTPHDNNDDQRLMRMGIIAQMLEYMSAGIPVIASNFSFWQEIIEDAECGICVDPLNPEEIANAIQFIIVHPEEAEQMGKNGRRAVEEKYNWDIEEKKLLEFYKSGAIFA